MEGSTDTPTEPSIEQRRIPAAGLAAIIATISANVVVYLLARAVGAIPDDLPEGMSMFGIGAIVFITILTLTIATIAMWGFARFSTMPIRNFTTLTIIVFVTSLPPVFGLDISMEFTITLVTMHGATAMIAWWCLTRLSRVG